MLFRSAVQEGIVPGGGTALVRAIQSLDGLKGFNHDQDVGVSILRRAMEEPLRQIVTNSGDEASVVVSAVKSGSGNYGYNAATGEYGDMFEFGIIDPAKVTRTALQNAASVAGLLITTEVVVSEIPQENGDPIPNYGMM